jgi:hypothetical protein
LTFEAFSIDHAAQVRQRAAASRRDVFVVQQLADLNVLAKHARDQDHGMNAAIPLPASVFSFERT